MKQTSKVVAGLVIVLLVVLVGGFLYLYSNLDSLVARLIEQHGSEATQTKVAVGAVSIDLQAGSAGIASLSVGNPDGFSSEPAISLRDFAIDLDPTAITGDPLVISDITVDGAQLRIEQNGTQNNLKTILSSLQRLSAGDQAEPESAGKKLIIDRFELTGASALLLVPELGEEREVQVPQIVVTDIGRASNGATAAAVAKQVLEPVIRQALESAAADGLEDAIKEKLDDGKAEIGTELLDRLGGKDSGNDEKDEETGDDEQEQER
ncbi:MAG: hypothetical protein ACREQ8_09825 [Woeseiaceae bacterium]